MTASHMSLIPLSLLPGPCSWSQERKNHALLIGKARPEDVWGDVADIPVSSPFMNRHAMGCVCCNRDPVAMVLAQVFQDRVTGRRPFFHEVAVLTAPQEMSVLRQQLENDVLVRARYRLVS
ncbi:hypothetical protein [Gluconobacter kondonii]|uniref:hypothetical protein n=1 Tax=Gluconobacter kondonii TaxID=941463 RepID=UPI001B8B242F|nr:hypothetical protein [Gluconobacter kondonii]MBS1054068.1 hypothetical protein [Gluconobacter kondonii]MBS1055180.1 hypothetical protein [Gluconobacter kondonii]